MTVKIDGTNTVANPAFTGADTDTGLQCGTNELKLVTGGTARATVDSSGDLGIGTTSPSTLIHGEASTAELRLKSTGASNSALVSFIPGTQTDPFYVYFTPARNLIFQDNSTERMRILSGGGLTFNGDTAQANALDDYEEGTWTPTFTCTSANFSYSDQSGLYTKIGNIVTINFRLQLQSRTSGSGALNIAGLPFTPTDSRCVLSISPAFGVWGSNNAPIHGFATGGAILLKKFDSSNAQDRSDTNIDPSIVSTAGVIGSMSYKIA